MEERSQQMSSICRFCLCQDNLISLTTTTVYSFSVQDVELYTGIPICDDEQRCYAICHKCRQRIGDSVNFRDSCLNNDIVFKKIFSSPNGFATSARHETPKNTVYEVTQIEILNDTPDNAVDALSVSDDCQKDANTLKVFRGNSLDDSESILQSSEKRTNRTIKRKNEKKLCVNCGMLVSDLTRHAMRIHSNKTNSCPYCNIKINDLGNLRRHVNSVHIKKIAKSCELCNKGFTNKGSYLSHMQSQHSIGETYEFDICSKTFNHKSNYRAHCSRVHGKDKNVQYKCATCCKVFQNKAVLHVHQRVHSDDRPYACNQCSKRFKSSFARNAHQLTHSGVQFSCTVCSKSFKYKSVLYTHLKKDHPKDLTTEANDCNNANNNAP